MDYPGPPGPPGSGIEFLHKGWHEDRLNVNDLFSNEICHIKIYLYIYVYTHSFRYLLFTSKNIRMLLVSHL